jgi:hypothetical protein
MMPPIVLALAVVPALASAAASSSLAAVSRANPRAVFGSDTPIGALSAAAFAGYHRGFAEESEASRPSSPVVGGPPDPPPCASPRWYRGGGRHQEPGPLRQAFRTIVHF